MDPNRSGKVKRNIDDCEYASETSKMFLLVICSFTFMSLPNAVSHRKRGYIKPNIFF